MTHRRLHAHQRHRSIFRCPGSSSRMYVNILMTLFASMTAPQLLQHASLSIKARTSLAVQSSPAHRFYHHHRADRRIFQCARPSLRIQVIIFSRYSSEIMPQMGQSASLSIKTRTTRPLRSRGYYLLMLHVCVWLYYRRMLHLTALTVAECSASIFSQSLFRRTAETFFRSASELFSSAWVLTLQSLFRRMAGDYSQSD